MKTIIQSIVATVLLCVAAQAANVTVYDSIVTLATNGTKNYTFTDSSSGQSVVVAVTVTGYSPVTNTSSLQSLDGDTRVGGYFQNGFVNGSGVNFSASLVSSSGGVAAGTVAFRIAGLGVRPVDSSGSLTWTSSTAGLTFTYLSGAEIIQSLDTANASLSGASYSSQMRFPDAASFQLTDVPAPGQSLVMNVSFTVTNSADPRTNSWFTTYSGKYARIYTNDAQKLAGTSRTTWSNGTQTQSNPAYCGVQEVYSSSNYVYVRSTGLGSHVLGPWYLNAAHTQAFPNYPVNTKMFWRFPRSISIPATKTQTSLGAIGMFVDGVAMFDSSDGFVWTGSTESGSGTGYWHREAYYNEGVTFDPGYAHQENTGTHHYHANPIALRYLLGDHVDFNSSTKIYSESTNAVTKHSPILAWVKDGLPVYGPYGYSNALDASSPIIRMRSGFQLRNGQNGTDNLVPTNSARTTIPAWAQRLYGVAAAQSGPSVTSVSPYYNCGRYMEDYAYLGDLTNTATGTNYRQGYEFDLNEYNARFCVTPEFPSGTWAYFVSMETNGTPKYPNNIGRAFYGNPTGGSVTSITETVATNFLGNTNIATKLTGMNVSNSVVTLAWSGVEGAYYTVQSLTNLATATNSAAWIALATNVQPVVTAGSYTHTSTIPQRFYRVARTGAATFDSAGTTSISGGGGGGSTAVAPGGSATRGTTVTVTITITAPPNLPPANAPITSVTLAGTIVGTSVSYPSSGTVIATFAIPANAPTGAQNIVVTFNAPVYTLTGAFTIN